MIGDYLEVYTFEYLMANALSRIPDEIDKRQGSIIYDALAPFCYELAEYYMELKKVLQNTFVETATGEYLGLRVIEQGIKRSYATYAVKKGVFVTASDLTASIPVGTRFSTISDEGGLNYYVLAPYTENGVVVPGSYQMKCETLGVIGNNYSGKLLPLDNIQNLKSATLEDIITPAQDEESDNELRARYFEKINQKSFGGNIAQYDEMLKGIDGIGDAQIYPVWNGGGTVKCSIVDTQHNRVSNDFIQTVQALVDPVQGQGLGMAPIGHTVTITTPTNVSINVDATVAIKNGYTLVQLTPYIEAAIESYLAELRASWGVPAENNVYNLSVYVARVISAILNVPGVANVTATTINGGNVDITLQENGTTQQLPILGTVTLHE